MQISELIIRHGELKADVEARDAMKKELTAEFQTQLKSKLEARWGNPGEDLEKVRAELMSLAEVTPEMRIEDNAGVVRIYDRSAGYEVAKPEPLANWLMEHKRGDVITFDKKELNKVMGGLIAANIALPEGVTPTFSRVLEVKAARPEAVE